MKKSIGTKSKKNFPNGIYSICLTLLMSICHISNSLAIDKHPKNKQWTDLFVSGSLCKTKLKYLFQTQSRYNFNPDQLERALVAGGIGVQITPQLEFLVGYQWISSSSLSDVKPTSFIWQQFSWQLFENKYLSIAERSRFEEVKREKQAQWLDVMRQRITIKFPIAILHTLTPVIYDEIFFHFNRPPWEFSRSPSQNRMFLGFDIPVAKKSFIEIGYMNRFLFRTNNIRRNNIIYFGVNILT